jgi:hypothetical protein
MSERPVIHPHCKHAGKLTDDAEDTYCNLNGARAPHRDSSSTLPSLPHFPCYEESSDTPMLFACPAECFSLCLRFCSKMLFGITSIDPTTFAGVSALFVGIALVARYIPARRAMRVDPMEAVRYE